MNPLTRAVDRITAHPDASPDAAAEAAILAAAAVVWDRIQGLPAGPCRTLAQRSLETAAYWASRAIEEGPSCMPPSTT
ncbi:hypothetical protein P7L78_26445 [Tistrella bauzanensis]|uniref:hypothetical protein n=1 Tax=Tistrella TaxID=171436 RepID=UPI0031F6F851